MATCRHPAPPTTPWWATRAPARPGPGPRRSPGRARRHDGELTQTWSNPGLPAHVYRRSDVDPKAAQRREREVATFFGVSTLGTLLFIVAYFAIKPGGEDILDEVSLSTKLLGLGLGLALFCIGAGAIHWAKTLMPDDEIVQDRKPMRSSEEDRAAGRRGDEGGRGGSRPRPAQADPQQPARRHGSARAARDHPAARPRAAARRRLDRHLRGRPARRVVTDPTGRPIKAADDPDRRRSSTSSPRASTNARHPLNERAKATTLVIRLEPDEIQDQKQRDWSVDGIVAYTKICTHVGCPVGLYEQQTHHLLCPCHQSTFDVTRDCAVIFGPAARPLPQLPLDVDEEGYLVAREDFQEPVGPSFWERG